MASNNSFSKVFQKWEVGKLGDSSSCSVCNPSYAQELYLLSSIEKGRFLFQGIFQICNTGDIL